MTHTYVNKNQEYPVSQRFCYEKFKRIMLYKTVEKTFLSVICWKVVCSKCSLTTHSNEFWKLQVIHELQNALLQWNNTIIMVIELYYKNAKYVVFVQWRLSPGRALHLIFGSSTASTCFTLLILALVMWEMFLNCRKQCWAEYGKPCTWVKIILQYNAC